MIKSDMRFKDVTSLNLVNLLIADIEEALKILPEKYKIHLLKKW